MEGFYGKDRDEEILDVYEQNEEYRYILIRRPDEFEWVEEEDEYGEVDYYTITKTYKVTAEYDYPYKPPYYMLLNPTQFEKLLKR